MPCSSCGAQIAEPANFCYSCGRALPAGSSSSGVPWGFGDMAKAIGLVVVGTVAASILTVLIAFLVAGDLDLAEDPTALTIVLVGNVFLELVLVCSAVYFSVRKYRVPWSDLGVLVPRRGGFWLTLGLAIALVIGALILNAAYFVTLAVFGVEPDTDLPSEYFANAGPAIVIGLISLGFAPIMEEIFFRGFIFGGLRGRWGVVLAAMGSGLLFALAHVGNPGTLYLVPPIAAIGALFAFAYAYSGSLLTTMVAHLLFNTLSFAISVNAAS